MAAYLYLEIDMELYTYKYTHPLQHFDKALPLFQRVTRIYTQHHHGSSTKATPTPTDPTLLSSLPISKRLDSSAPDVGLGIRLHAQGSRSKDPGWKPPAGPGH